MRDAHFSVFVAPPGNNSINTSGGLLPPKVVDSVTTRQVDLTL